MSIKEFYKEVFCLNLKDFPNFGIDFEINKLIFFVTLGLCAASVYFNLIESDIALILKKLLRIGAIGEENARSLSELGLASHKRIRRLILKNTGSLRRVISTVGLKRQTYEEFIATEKAKRDNSVISRLIKNIKSRLRKADSNAESSDTEPVNKATETEKTLNNEPSASANDIDTVKLYISKDRQSLAEKMFSQNESSLLKTVASCLLLLAAGLVIMMLMPTFLNFISA